MSWSDPTSVPIGNSVPTGWFDEVAENQRVSHKGDGQASVTPISADGSNQLDINDTDHFFVINSATNNIALILTENREPSNGIILLADSCTPTIVSTGTPTGNYKSIKIWGGASNHTMASDGMVMLKYYNGYWYLGRMHT